MTGWDEDSQTRGSADFDACDNCELAFSLIWRHKALRSVYRNTSTPSLVSEKAQRDLMHLITLKSSSHFVHVWVWNRLILNCRTSQHTYRSTQTVRAGLEVTVGIPLGENCFSHRARVTWRTGIMPQYSLVTGKEKNGCETPGRKQVPSQVKWFQ